MRIESSCVRLLDTIVVITVYLLGLLTSFAMSLSPLHK